MWQRRELWPSRRWHVCLYEKGTSNVVDGAYGTLGLAILLGCVGA
jgi:hypothetical protein